ncbi:hypothetical protein [Streptomyces sp. x-19]
MVAAGDGLRIDDGGLFPGDEGLDDSGGREGALDLLAEAVRVDRLQRG